MTDAAARTWGRAHLRPLLVLGLLAAAHTTAGCSGTPAPAPTAAPAVASPASAATPASFRLTDVATASGLAFKHTHGTTAPLTIVETMGSGCAFLDYDADGWLDVFMVNSGDDFRAARQRPGSRLYRNTGKGTFEDVTARSGISVDAYGMGCCAGDYDNDGRLDLFVTGYGKNFLYRNRGDGTFQDTTHSAGIPARPGAWGTGCAFVDVNRDGQLDLYVANYVRYDPAIPFCPSGSVMTGCTPHQYRTQRNELYVNQGGGRFADRAEALGAADPAGAGLGVVVCDFDNDGWPDLFIANDGTPNALLHNRRGTFKNIADEVGVAFAENGLMRAGMGADAGDYDGDGRFDLIITNFQHEPNSLYRNEDATFEETTFPTGIGARSIPRLGFGVCWADLDLDGRVDLYVGNGHVFDNVEKFDDSATFEQPDQVFLNVAGERFEERELGIAPSVARGLAPGDFNNDGAPDILVNSVGRPARLLRNEPSEPRSWLGLILRGKQSNRSAVGARVELSTPAGKQVREVRSGGSYCSQGDLRVLFGLASLQDPAQVQIRIRWPAGGVQTLRSPALNRYLVVDELPGSPAPKESAP